MIEQPKLTAEEWGLIVQLLERERSDLPVEIHHTRTSTIRTELRERLDMVAGLLERLREPAVVGHA